MIFWFRRDYIRVHCYLLWCWNHYFWEMRSKWLDELLYPGIMTLISESLEGFKGKLEVWKGALESKRQIVNTKKTKMIYIFRNLKRVRKERKLPCGVCRRGISSNSIFCQLSKHWLHERWSVAGGALKQNDELKYLKVYFKV